MTLDEQIEWMRSKQLSWTGTVCDDQYGYKISEIYGDILNSLQELKEIKENQK